LTVPGPASCQPEYEGQEGDVKFVINCSHKTVQRTTKWAGLISNLIKNICRTENMVTKKVDKSDTITTFGTIFGLSRFEACF
jgi:hypothetical protein